MTCGANCWKDGKLWKIVCSEKETKKKPSITIPSNFPGTVTVTPGEEPYPDDENNQIGPVTSEPTRQPEIGPTTPEPTRQPQIGPTVPVTPPIPIQGGKPVGSSRPSQNFNANQYGCDTHDGYKSCRYGIGTGPNAGHTKESGNQATPVSSLIGNSNHFYAIFHFHTQSQSGSGKGKPI